MRMIDPTHHLPTPRESLLDDSLAGLVVFFVAVPLCLGIALASGAPLLSGVIAGVVGGVIVGALSNSPVSVSGPAAGLTVICAEALVRTGSFSAFLTAVALAGLIQIGFGLVRLGAIAEYCPNAVIKGMLSGIGAVIILKQIPHALGRSGDTQGDMWFWQLGSNENTLTTLVSAVYNFHPIATLIAGAGLIILLSWDLLLRTPLRSFSRFPPSIIVIGVGVFLDHWLSARYPGYALNLLPGHYVELPRFTSLADVWNGLEHPTVHALLSAPVWVAAGTIAVVASIESLLSVEASDKIDPYRRITSTNRELVAQGIGNLVSGLLGGLPVTAVILRSSTNVFAGAKTKSATIIHGALLLVCCLALSEYLNRIPLAALAAILIIVGYKLISPTIVREMFRGGADQYIPFVITVIAIMFTDLLTGVLLGLSIGLFLVLKTNHHDAVSIVNEGDEYLMRFNKDLSFVNKSELKRSLRRIPDGATVFIDGAKAMFIDKDAYDLLKDFEEQAKYRGISLTMRYVQRKNLGFLSKNPE
jgi:MFS superfamily sulfate permease-like transporter